jgi:DNA-binding GntR family transcriptional regulator
MAPSKTAPSLGEDSRFSEVVEQLSSGYKTTGQMVYDVIHQAIVTGAFAPGQWLRQEALAAAIGVSRIPVRSALLQLESEGLVTFHPHRGARVRTLSPDQIDEIYRLRILLESYALRRSMTDMTPARLARIQELADQLDNETEGSNFLNTRVRFYREAYDSTGSPLLLEIIEELRGHVGRYLLSFRMNGDRESTAPHQHQHSGLVAAMTTGDIDTAERYLKDHLTEVQKGIQALAADDTGEADLDEGEPPAKTERGATRRGGRGTSTRKAGGAKAAAAKTDGSKTAGSRRGSARG